MTQVVEGDETIVIPGTTTTQVGLTVSSATVTLTDDDKSTTTPGDDGQRGPEHQRARRPT